ncbi:helix-turn-helix transcriptional regulator [Actinoplanes solisilvae]|uniref:helix-turn-helix transcriptional regulator n=1 Tax=Actinoplanes solisilvae TaxID=2486853 RepID=UPI000FD895A8|nr:helix-turn-helix transcriptional regulator [Actinoplanes solisilvae]
MDANTPRTTSHELAGAEAIEQFLTAAYGTSMRIAGEGERQLLHHQRSDAGFFAVESAYQTARLSFRVEPLHALIITRTITGRVDRSTEGAETRYGAGDLYIISRPDRPHTTRWQAGQVESCILDPGSLELLAAPAPGRRPASIRFTGLDPGSPELARRFWQVRTYVAEVVADPAAAGAPLLLAGAARLLAAAVLVTFPNTALIDPTIEDRHDATPRTLRLAMSYIDDHAAEDISVADIASAASVSIRALHLAFRRHLATSPTAHLRRARLAHAHADLIDADPADTTVAAVAARWGFASNSRFVASYRGTFGVTPRTTLQRR